MPLLGIASELSHLSAQKAVAGVFGWSLGVRKPALFQESSKPKAQNPGGFSMCQCTPMAPPSPRPRNRPSCIGCHEPLPALVRRWPRCPGAWRAAKSWRRLGLSDPALVRRFLVFEGPSDAKNLGEPDTEALEANGVSGSRLAASRLAFFWSRLF